MYIVKNAWKNIKTAKGRNIMIGVIAAVIATAACIALSISHSAAVLEQSGIRNLSVTANISLDRQALMQTAMSTGQDPRTALQNYQDLSLDQLQKYAASKYVTDFVYTLSSSVAKTANFNPFDASASSGQPNGSAGTNSGQVFIGGGTAVSLGGASAMGDFRVYGVSSAAALTDFTGGTDTMTGGGSTSVIFDPDDPTRANNICLITDQLASYNSLKAGDTITVANPNDAEETYSLTVGGVYTTDSSSSLPVPVTAMDPQNQIYVSYATLKAITDHSASVAAATTDGNGSQTTTAMQAQVSGTFFIDNPTDFVSFQNDCKAMGLGGQYTVSSPDIDQYNQSIIPLQNTSQFAMVLLLIVLAVGGVILVVLNIFNIRERKYEVGVLTAIGMKKSKVALQFLCELLIVTFIAVLIGAVIGSVASVPVASALLQSQVSAQQNSADSQSGNGRYLMSNQGGAFRVSGGVVQAFDPNSNTSYVDKITAVISPPVLGELIVVGLLLTVIASLGAVIFISRYEPLKILSNRA